MKKETTTPKVIKGYKGYDNNLQCRGKQYEIGKEYTEPSAVACESGIHFCENPFDVWNYYPLQNGNRFTEVDGSGELSTHEDDSKVAATNVKIGIELSLKGMIEAGVKFIFEKTKSSKETTATTGNRANAATTGDRANAATTGNSANAATTGENCIAAALGQNSKAKGALGNWLVVGEWEQDKDYNSLLVGVATARVDGKKIKPDTWYTAKNGKLVISE